MADDDDFGGPRRRPKPRGENLLDTRRKRGSNKTMWIVLAVLGCLFVCGLPIGIALLLPAVTKVREAAVRKKSMDNLEQIGEGIKRYEEVNGTLPQDIFAPDGTALLSWRVRILPHIDQQDLYDKFKLEEPWDSLTNRPLVDLMPEVYENHRADQDRNFGQTLFAGFGSPGTAFEPRVIPTKSEKGKSGPPPGERKFRIADFKDDPSQTILVAEGATFMQWTRPNTLSADASRPVTPLLGNQGKVKETLVLFANFTVKAIRPGQPDDVWRALATHSGKDAVPPDYDQ